MSVISFRKLGHPDTAESNVIIRQQEAMTIIGQQEAMTVIAQQEAMSSAAGSTIIRQQEGMSSPDNRKTETVKMLAFMAVQLTHIHGSTVNTHSQADYVI
jgi:hypothetical protein